MSAKIKPWEQLEVKLVHSSPFFELYLQKLRSPKNGYVDEFYYMEVMDWVNIIPITSAGEVVLIRQFRFGVQLPSLEIPGGMLKRRDEDPKEAALRELREETGYVAKDANYLGWIYPNPAIQTNRCHMFVADNVCFENAQRLDPAEDIEVELVKWAQIPHLIEAQQISHALVVTALFRYLAQTTQNLNPG